MKQVFRRFLNCFCFALLFFMSLVPLSNSQANAFNPQDTSLSTTTYYVWDGTSYHEALLSVEPTILGEPQLMNKLIAINIVYPEEAREKRIGGTVIITVILDEEGTMEDSFVSQHVGGGCSEEALHAVRLLDYTGFEPAEVNGVPVKVKFDIPIRFALPGE